MQRLHAHAPVSTHLGSRTRRSSQRDRDPNKLAGTHVLRHDTRLKSQDCPRAPKNRVRNARQLTGGDGGHARAHTPSPTAHVHVELPPQQSMNMTRTIARSQRQTTHTNTRTHEHEHEHTHTHTHMNMNRVRSPHALHEQMAPPGTGNYAPCAVEAHARWGGREARERSRWQVHAHPSGRAPRKESLSPGSRRHPPRAALRAD